MEPSREEAIAMPIQRVYIYKGQITIGDYFGGDDPRDWSPGVNFQLFQDGKPVHGEYRGNAYVGEGRVNIDRGTTVEELTIDERPTPESAEAYAGWMHAMKQKRRRDSDKWTSDFYHGWRSAWEERRKAGV